MREWNLKQTQCYQVKCVKCGWTKEVTEQPVEKAIAKLKFYGWRSGNGGPLCAECALDADVEANPGASSK